MSSYALCSLKVEEALERSNKDYLWSTISQSILAGFATEQTLSSCSVSFGTRILCSSAVTVSTLANGFFASKDYSVATLIHDHIGSVAITAAIAANILICINGAPIYGATALAFFTFTVIEQTGYLPSAIHTYLYSSNFVLTNGCRILIGGPIGQCAAVASIVYHLYFIYNT